MTSASIGVENQLQNLDSSIGFAPKVFADRREDLSRLLWRLAIPDHHNAPGIVGVNGIGHRVRS